MKRFLILSFSLFLLICVKGQDSTQPGYQFTVVKQNPITAIKNQWNTGTCWSFSAVAFLESELLRTGKGEHNLSEMYIVRRNYSDKASKYVRLGGNLNFSEGGSFADAIETLNEYGIIPSDLYKGLNYGEEKHKHAEMTIALKGYLDGIVANKNGRLSTAWYNGFNGVLDAYFGALPTQFQYQGKSYTNPQEFAKYLGLNSDNYVSITSFTHHPFYAPFALEVSDNWRWALSYNLPLDDMIASLDNALEKGYTVAWASDVSELGFTRNGVGVVPDELAMEGFGSDQARWLGLSRNEQQAVLKSRIAQSPMKEKVITQEIRQVGFDNLDTTDDHGMLIYGIAKDQNGAKYYMIKNSWGEVGSYKGIWYVSEAFVRYKTTSMMFNKESLPKDIAKKMKL